MTLTKYNPNKYTPTSFSSLLNGFFDDSIHGGRQMDFTPSVDIAETETSFELQVHIPGVRKADVEITVENTQLTIRGERKFENDEKNKSFHSRESYYGKFSRKFNLPDTVNTDSIKAKQEDGILFIAIPKDEKKTAKKAIKIG